MIPVLIKSLQHPIVKELAALRAQKKMREQTRSVLIFGKKLILELGNRFPLQLLILTEDQALTNYPKAKKTYLATENILKKITGLKNPEGCAAVLNLPEESDLSRAESLLVLDHIQDPGNLGTLLRTALAFCYDGVFLIEGCDPFNEKALRSSMGSIFHLPYKRGSTQELLNFLKTQSMMGICADLQGEPLCNLKLKKPYALILGSESHGIDPKLSKACKSVTIPMSENSESLNVAIAGGILLYAMDPRRLR